MAGFDNIAKKAQGLFEDGKEKAAAAFEDGKEKFDEVRTSEKAEQVSDNILGGLANAANKVTGGKYADKIENARDAADKKIGPDSVE
ncbi:hypothetical protein EDF46_2853 [Frondihabitans sp. PhB188]|uniref:antitoxin n=1 Tax=Frondihabitans sp. PhB188 TaxID=2485200 RepID=UPI000F4633C1|nr:antitoxin [Frondihabitans sp. PhB188]ROQ37397.1 hypothetical protein EDF46_2853 [Frondihabitans sp. PhB188]